MWDLTLVLMLICFWYGGTIWLHWTFWKSLHFPLRWNDYPMRFAVIYSTHLLFSIGWYWIESEDTKTICSASYWLLLITKMVDCTVNIVKGHGLSLHFEKGDSKDFQNVGNTTVHLNDSIAQKWRLIAKKAWNHTCKSVANKLGLEEYVLLRSGSSVMLMLPYTNIMKFLFICLR